MFLSLATAICVDVNDRWVPDTHKIEKNGSFGWLIVCTILLQLSNQLKHNVFQCKDKSLICTSKSVGCRKNECSHFLVIFHLSLSCPSNTLKNQMNVFFPNVYEFVQYSR